MKKFIALIMCLTLWTLSACANGYNIPSDREFSNWVKDFKKEALAAGVSSDTFDKAFEDVTFNEKVIALDRRQAEFKLSFWEYLDRMVNNAKVNTGRSLYKKYPTLLRKIEKKYGVPGHYIIAFWGMESNFGMNFGGFNVIESLATLSFDTRRPKLFKRELLNALKIAETNKINPKDMKGSWAGAMGHFQFLPSTYMKNAVDFDGDGKKDIWNSLPDAFASAANYLKNIGWKPNQKWGREVFLPDNLSWVRLNNNLTRTIGEWKAAEIVPSDGKAMIGSNLEATIMFPGGHKAPVFLLYHNYEVITKWNRSLLYAIGVGHFADRVIGGGKLKTKRNKLFVANAKEVRRVQTLMTEEGFYDSDITGFAGVNTREGVRAAQEYYDMPIDGYISKQLIKRLEKESRK